MRRIKHTVSTLAVVVAAAGLIAPAAQARADGLYPRFTPNEHVSISIDRVPPPVAHVHGGTWLEHRALENTVALGNVQAGGRTVTTSGGIDWTVPAMGAVAFLLVMMIVGERILVRRGRLAT